MDNDKAGEGTGDGAQQAAHGGVLAQRGSHLVAVDAQRLAHVVQLSAALHAERPVGPLEDRSPYTT